LTGKVASNFVHAHGRNVGEIMTQDDLCTAREGMPLDELVRMMERRNIKAFARGAWR